ncbi:MAG: hypothetical protein AMXMBFR56_24240 [Polyangiaceae bacterium]
MRTELAWLAPLALFGTACSSWYRAGPEVRSIDGRLAAGGKATVEGGVEQLLFPLALSGGVTTDDGKPAFALETGGELVSPIGESNWAWVAGPRFTGMLSGPSGTAFGLNGGPFVDLSPESGGDATVLSLELFAGSGVSGDIRGGLIGGATLSLGSLHLGRFTVPAGRVLRVDGHAVTAKPVEIDDWAEPYALRLAGKSDRERRARGHEWLRAALDEHASIAAFAQLALELGALGAPASLLAAAGRAAWDEVRHARSCFSLASAYLGRRLGPGPLPRPTKVLAPSLEKLARESLTDGCFGEGLAARLAKLQSAVVDDPVEAAVLRGIARDEARHAELGWRTLEWCLHAGSAGVRPAVTGALSSYRAPRSRDEALNVAGARTERAVHRRAAALLSQYVYVPLSV